MIPGGKAASEIETGESPRAKDSPDNGSRNGKESGTSLSSHQLAHGARVLTVKIDPIHLTKKEGLHD
jgi:hypothetical protein